MGRLNDLAALGQAIWLDFVARDFLNEGGLKKLVDEDGVTGVTSNPTIFQQAMGPVSYTHLTLPTSALV